MKKLIFLILLLPSFSWAATYYASPSGSGTTCSSGSPCTLTQGITTMSGGDILILADGTYTSALSGLDTGSSGSYTTIKAANDGGAIITGGFTVSANYVQIEGLKLTGTTLKAIQGNYIKILRTAFQGGPTTGNDVSLLINASTYVLLEDCWIYGLGGRYKLLTFQSDYVVIRRVVARHDGGWTCDGSNPEAGIQTYNSANVHIQNSIVIDPATSSCPLGNFSTTRHDNPPYTKLNTNNSWVGCMVINGDGLTHGFMGDLDANGTQTITDFVAIDLASSWGFSAGSDPGTFTFNRAAFKGTGGEGGMGRWGSSSVSAINVIVTGFSSDDFDGVSPTYFDTYNNGETQTGTGRVTYNPQTSGWLYPIRIEDGSALKTAGSSGGQIGPNIVNKIGTSGTLYGETGWNTDTGDDLWPWPYEDRIKTDMAAVSTRGFAAAGNDAYGQPLTLTRYIWQYLGNEIPSEIYGEEEDTTAPSVTISTTDPTNIQNTSSLSISGTASDAVGVSSCKWRIGSAPDGDNGTALTGTTSWSGTVTGLSVGANTVYAGCTDAAGNWGSDSMTVNMSIVGMVPPGISIVGATFR